jgi:hypothetical protein
VSIKGSKVAENAFGKENIYANPLVYHDDLDDTIHTRSIYKQLTSKRNVVFNPEPMHEECWIHCKEEAVGGMYHSGMYDDIVIAVHKGDKLTEKQLQSVKTKINKKFPGAISKLLKIPHVDVSFYLQVGKKYVNSYILKHCIISMFRMLVRRQLKLSGLPQDVKHSKYVNKIGQIVKKRGLTNFIKSIDKISDRMLDAGYESNGPESFIQEIEYLYGKKKDIQILLDLCLP